MALFRVQLAKIFEKYLVKIWVGWCEVGGQYFGFWAAVFLGDATLLDLTPALSGTPSPWMGRGKLGESWRAPNTSWGVAGADGKLAGFSEDFQGAAGQADTPRLAAGACQETVGFCLGEPGAGAPGQLVRTETKQLTTKTKKNFGPLF